MITTRWLCWQHGNSLQATRLNSAHEPTLLDCPRPPPMQMFNGWVKRFKHSSAELGCDMLFTVFFPPAAAAEGVKVPVSSQLRGTGHLFPVILRLLRGKEERRRKGGTCEAQVGRRTSVAPSAPSVSPLPRTARRQVVYYLSGLTCTDENFTLKAGAQRTAAELGLALVAPDTSPRGLNIEGEEDRWVGGCVALLPRLLLSCQG